MARVFWTSCAHARKSSCALSAICYCSLHSNRFLRVQTLKKDFLTATPAKENPNQHKLAPTIFPISENGNLSYKFVFSLNCLFRHSHCPHPDQSLHHLLSKLLQQPVNLPTSTPAHCFIINIVVKVILLKYTPAQPA